VVTPVNWDSPQTADLFGRACADCHSNETVWPWYARVAPVSWLVARDVNEGREEFNLSDLSSLNGRKLNEMPREIDEKVSEGEMPMAIYLPLHPGAVLSAAEKQALIDGLQKTLSLTLAK
jgi:mono/diheme cytochrome c family protein